MSDYVKNAAAWVLVPLALLVLAAATHSLVTHESGSVLAAYTADIVLGLPLAVWPRPKTELLS